MICPQCNAQLPDGIKFCSICGIALTNNTASQATHPQPEFQTEHQPEPQMDYQSEPQADYQPEQQFDPTYQYSPQPVQQPAQQYAQPAPQYNYQYNQPSPQYAQPMYSNRREMTEDELPEKFSPLGAWAYFGLKLLFCIPIVGLVFLIVFSFNDGNRARRNFARSYWCELLVFTIILLVLVIITLAGVGTLGYYF